MSLSTALGPQRIGQCVLIFSHLPLNSCDYIFCFRLWPGPFSGYSACVFFNKLKATSDRFLRSIVLKSIRSKSHVGLIIYEKFLRKKKVLKQDATYKNVISYLIFVWGILHSNDLLVTNEYGIYVIFSQHNKLCKWIQRFLPCWFIKYNYIKKKLCVRSLDAMTILFSLHYYGTIHQELLEKISGKKNMRNT
jgi:hypothetical protein